MERTWMLWVSLTLLLSKGVSAQLPLKGYNVDAAETSVSGLSSGGYMAVQFHVAFSATIKGAGITAGGPFYCAQGLVANALSRCAVAPALIPVTSLMLLTNTDAFYNLIDPTSNLRDSRVFLISGTKDTVIVPGVMERLEEYYSYFVRPENIATMFTLPAGHGQVTNDYGSNCGNFFVGPPFIINCGYSSAFEILKHIYGDIFYAPNSAMVPTNLMMFPQSEFFSGWPHTVSMDTIGYVYVPTFCQHGGACRLHIAFHGCAQGRDAVGDAFARHAGYNGVAEVNNIIVLYPQVSNKFLTNPTGCWDWWGYTDPIYYGVKKGPQMAGVKRMLDRIANNY